MSGTCARVLTFLALLFYALLNTAEVLGLALMMITPIAVLFAGSLIWVGLWGGRVRIRRRSPRSLFLAPLALAVPRGALLPAPMLSATLRSGSECGEQLVVRISRRSTGLAPGHHIDAFGLRLGTRFHAFAVRVSPDARWIVRGDWPVVTYCLLILVIVLVQLGGVLDLIGVVL